MNERLASQLKRSLTSTRAMHGYLITGADGSYVQRFLKECASLLLFGNEDISRLQYSPDYFPLDGTAKVESIREIRRELAKQTYTGGNRVVSIERAHLLNDNSNNAMLKMLEEPPEGTFFLLSGQEMRIIPTIRSRCMIIRLGELNQAELAYELSLLGADMKDADDIAQMSFGSSEIAETLLSSKSSRQLRKDALAVFIKAIDGEISFASSKTIGEDRSAALTSCFFMYSLCRDIINIKCNRYGFSGIINADFRDEAVSIADRLPFSAIAGIISALNTCQSRLSPSAQSAQVLDRLIVDIAELNHRVNTAK